ncbi:arylamine N-acetyltransferase [Actinomadura barringtoniae]|uniref:Arylamine N-acetyltransferase n=1 Tax=Actinomadura barringtoniae TaxID=1427535 RepID=A0A939P6R3_9ACTN|nr:arylamine N-acetyltransferase [Actinomadura barringtoniae]
MDVDAYLRRLGITDPGRPSVSALRTLHKAHVERIPYEALDIQLGRITSIDPHDSAARITELGRGGYCYHLNGALSLLLQELGYEVVWHRAGVQTPGEETPGSQRANHLGLTVRNLPSPESPSGDWLVDAGLGDGIHGPLPLRNGEYREGPFRFRLRPSETDPGGWRFDHDPGGSFAGIDFAPEPATLADFTDRHVYLSTSPESGFVRTCVVQRRDADGVDTMRGCTLLRTGDSTPRTINDQAEWFAALADIFDLAPTDLTQPDRDALWQRVRATHEAWQATRSA